MLTYEGSIEDVLASGEYDAGDMALVTYDELFDLVEQAKMFKSLWEREFAPRFVNDPANHAAHRGMGIGYVERRTNRPLHPVLGGKSPYSEFLPI